jgi:hypothetical protein
VKFVFLRSNLGNTVPINPEQVTHIDFFYDGKNKVFGRCLVSLTSGLGFIVQANSPQEVVERIYEQLGVLVQNGGDSKTE